MKSIIIIVALSAFFQNTNLGQSQDLQWLIINGNGKVSTNQTAQGTANVYYNGQNPNIVGSKMTITGVSNPNRNIITGHPKAKNNIFIIYKDGTHFNSRENANAEAPYYDVDYFYETGVFDSHRFKALNGISPAYMYLTNTYEEDDPPQGVKINDGLISNNACPSIHELDVTRPAKAITAIHDVVRSRDLVLIISNSVLKDSFGITGEYTLHIDKIQSKTGNEPVIQGVFFDQSQVFINGAGSLSVFPTNIAFGFDKLTGTFTFNTRESDYIYVVVRPENNTLRPYFTTLPSGDPSHEAIFNITAQGINAKIEHRENLVNAHDPNYIEFVNMKITRNPSRTWIRYRVHFQNISEYPTQEGIKVEVQFDNRYLMGSMKVLDWKVGNQHMNPLSSAQHRTDNRMSISCSDSPFASLSDDSIIKFEFTPNLLGFGGNADNGFVDFMIQSTDTNFEIPSVPIEPKRCYVYFGPDKTRILDFHDIVQKVKLKPNNALGFAFLRPVQWHNINGLQYAFDCN